MQKGMKGPRDRLHSHAHSRCRAACTGPDPRLQTLVLLGECTTSPALPCVPLAPAPLRTHGRLCAQWMAVPGCPQASKGSGIFTARDCCWPVAVQVKKLRPPGFSTSPDPHALAPIQPHPTSWKGVFELLSERFRTRNLPLITSELDIDIRHAQQNACSCPFLYPGWLLGQSENT